MTKNYALSGTYKLHLTEAAEGTTPKRVKPVCGQSTSRSYLRVVKAQDVENTLESPMVTKCQKCFG